MNWFRRIGAFVEEHLALEDRLAEALCGLVMVLGFTATARAMFEEMTTRQFVIAVLGCNAAWGIVDGFTYILINLVERGRRYRFVRAVQAAGSDTPRAIELTRQRLEQSMGSIVEQDDHRQQFYALMATIARAATPVPARLRLTDVFSAIACFITVFCCALPVVVPFLIVGDALVAARLSNGIAIVLLAVLGYTWAKHASVPPWWAAFFITLLGLVLVAVTIALGG